MGGLQRSRLNSSRRADPGEVSLGWWLLLFALLAVVAGVVAVWLPARIVDATTGGNPFGFIIELVTRRRPDGYPAAAVAGAVGLGAVFVAVVVVAVVVSARFRKGRSWVDARAQSMAGRRELVGLLPAGAHADAVRLGSEHVSDGPPLGRLLPGRDELRASWEWVQVWIMGPRAGKTTCVCVPQVVDTAGPVIATTNKRDLVDLTRGPRSMVGHTWVFDPQDIIGEPASWWWNPLTYVTGFAEATELAGLFAAADRDEGARTDAYFDGAAQNYLAALLLAAAVSREPITTVLEWANHPDDDTPAVALKLAEWDGVANILFGIIALADRQRDGVVGTATKALNWLANKEQLAWIAPTGPGDDRPEFDPATFVESTQTLYLVSREGRGTARAITAALTVATITAAEKIAGGGRLATPMMVVLDEAANVVRWPNLPDLYSHFGSKGIVVSTFLQSWNQGVAVWGRDGMEKLWSAANIRIIGSGLAQSDFLNAAAGLIGDHDTIRRDVSTSGKTNGFLDSGRNVSTRIQRERVLDAAELAALPSRRMVMLASGTRAALLATQHWTERDGADLITESIQHYGPKNLTREPAVKSA